MDVERQGLIRRGLEEYLAESEYVEPTLFGSYLPYDFDEIDSRRWRQPGDSLVKGELEGMTNIMNGWCSALRRWGAWNRVLAKVGVLEGIELRMEFADACAHQCLLQPSATRDALSYISLNAMHQIKLSLGNGYADWLPGDPKFPDKKHNYPPRSKKELRLKELTGTLSTAQAFFDLLRSIDDEQYRASTSDYRNRSSHDIGPCLGIGISQFVRRIVAPHARLEKGPDGQLIEVQGAMRPLYAIGGTPPLDMERAHAENKEQFRRARECFVCYRDLLREAMMSLPN